MKNKNEKKKKKKELKNDSECSKYDKVERVVICVLKLFFFLCEKKKKKKSVKRGVFILFFKIF